jgi:outer membrane autotransporter protein
MSIKIKNFIPLLLVAISANAIADEKPWTMSAGLSYRDTNFTLPTNKSSSEYWSTNLSLNRKVGEATWLGGTIAYNDGSTRYKTLNGNGDVDTKSVGAYITHYLSSGLYVNGALSYGKLDINNKFTTTKLDADGDYNSASLGLTQFLPLNQNLMSSLKAIFTHISSNIDSFTINTGTSVGDSNNSLNYFTLGGRLDYKMYLWTPYVHLDWQKASDEFIKNTGDDNYFTYGIGANFTVNKETSVGVSLNSVFAKRYVDDVNIGINLSHRF